MEDVSLTLGVLIILNKTLPTMNVAPSISLGNRLKIDPKSILMLKADINYTQIYFDDGSFHLSSINLGRFAKVLSEAVFFRPNRSVILNLNHVADFQHSPAQIRMKNNEIFDISRRRKRHFMAMQELIANSKAMAQMYQF